MGKIQNSFLVRLIIYFNTSILKSSKPHVPKVMKSLKHRDSIPGMGFKPPENPTIQGLSRGSRSLLLCSLAISKALFRSNPCIPESAPASISFLTTSVLPRFTASISGVYPSLFWELTLAPESRSLWMTGSCPRSEAHIRAVQPSRDRRFGLLP